MRGVQYGRRGPLTHLFFMKRSAIMASTTNPGMNRPDEKVRPPSPHATRPGEGCTAEPSSFGDRARETASAVAHTAEDAASYVGQKAEDATGAVGEGLTFLGNTIRDYTPQSGMVGEASSAVANSLESTGRYLQEEGLHGIAEEVTKLVRRNPIAALLVGVGIGVGVGMLIGRATTRGA
jgi:hypothetical protein